MHFSLGPVGRLAQVRLVQDYIVQYPVAFTGFKIFYHNDAKSGDPILTPPEVLRLLRRPLYIQYQ